MNTAGDYSAAYCMLHTTCEHSGHALAFTIGRGNELIVAAIPHFASQLAGRSLSSLVADFGSTWRALVSDSQVRWVGPEKGVTHLALGAVVNALWDLWGKVLGKPVWRVVCEMTPEEVVRCIDFRYTEDAISKEEAVGLLRDAEDGRSKRLEEAECNLAVPAYTTRPGWLGYSDEKMRQLLIEARDEGYRHFKLKVGGDVERDKQRLRLAQDIVGPENVLMVDANQVWNVLQAIDWMKQLAEFKPWFIEEPTSPDDILGHATVRNALKPFGIGVASGEMCQNRIMFKQFFQAGALDICQVDACRLGGLNEVLAVLLMAKKFNVAVIPHSGGVSVFRCFTYR